MIEQLDSLDDISDKTWNMNNLETGIRNIHESDLLANTWFA